MTVVKLKLLIFILLRHQKERTLDIYRTLRWHYPPLADQKCTLLSSAMKWGGRGQGAGMLKKERCIFTLRHLGKYSFIPLSLFSRPRCIWIGESKKSWSLRCSAQVNYLFIVKRCSFSFCTWHGSHPTRVARRRACNLAQSELKVLEMRCLSLEAVFIKPWTVDFLI